MKKSIFLKTLVIFSIFKSASLLCPWAPFCCSDDTVASEGAQNKNIAKQILLIEADYEKKFFGKTLIFPSKRELETFIIRSIGLALFNKRFQSLSEEQKRELGTFAPNQHYLEDARIKFRQVFGLDPHQDQREGVILISALDAIINSPLFNQGQRLFSSIIKNRDHVLWDQLISLAIGKNSKNKPIERDQVILSINRNLNYDRPANPSGRRTSARVSPEVSYAEYRPIVIDASDESSSSSETPSPRALPTTAELPKTPNSAWPAPTSTTASTQSCALTTFGQSPTLAPKSRAGRSIIVGPSCEKMLPGMGL